MFATGSLRFFFFSTYRHAGRLPLFFVNQLLRWFDDVVVVISATLLPFVDSSSIHHVSTYSSLRCVSVRVYTLCYPAIFSILGANKSARALAPSRALLRWTVVLTPFPSVVTSIHIIWLLAVGGRRLLFAIS